MKSGEDFSTHGTTREISFPVSEKRIGRDDAIISTRQMRKSLELAAIRGRKKLRSLSQWPSARWLILFLH